MFPEREVPLSFRRATLADLPALVRLEADTFELHRIDRRHFLRLLRSPSVYCLVAGPSEGHGGAGHAAGAIFAYGLVFLRQGKRRARLYSLAVDPSRRGQGLGGELVTRLMATLACVGQARLSLEVRAEDAPAIRFYERLGFRLMQHLPRYYDDGAEALRLVVPLPQGAELEPVLVAQKPSEDAPVPLADATRASHRSQPAQRSDRRQSRREEGSAPRGAREAARHMDYRALQ